MEKVKFRTMFNPAPVQPSNSGNEVYKWDYLDEKGELKTEEMNVYEKIQSFVKQTDYKKRIEMGEEINDNIGQYMDISALGGNPDGIYGYIDNLAKTLESYIQSQKLPQEAGEAGQTSSEASGQSPENPPQNPATEPQPRGGNE